MQGKFAALAADVQELLETTDLQGLAYARVKRV